MSAYIKTLKNTDGDIIYPQTKSEAIFNNEGVNIGEQLNESANKADKIIPSSIGNLASLDSTGNLDDSGKKVEELLNSIVITAPYSADFTYALGAYCNQNGVMYKCTTAITVAEAWDAAHWTETSVGAEIKILKSGKAAISYSAFVTLLAASWSSGSYTLNNEHITATNVVEMLPAEGITADQLKAVQKANIVGGTQTAGSMTLVALGTVPTIDIPVNFVFRGDL